MYIYIYIYHVFQAVTASHAPKTNNVSLHRHASTKRALVLSTQHMSHTISLVLLIRRSACPAAVST